MQTNNAPHLTFHAKLNSAEKVQLRPTSKETYWRAAEPESGSRRVTVTRGVTVCLPHVQHGGWSHWLPVLWVLHQQRNSRLDASQAAPERGGRTGTRGEWTAGTEGSGDSVVSSAQTWFHVWEKRPDSLGCHVWIFSGGWVTTQRKSFSYHLCFFTSLPLLWKCWFTRIASLI